MVFDDDTFDRSCNNINLLRHSAQKNQQDGRNESMLFQYRVYR